MQMRSDEFTDTVILTMRNFPSIINPRRASQSAPRLVQKTMASAGPRAKQSAVTPEPEIRDHAHRLSSKVDLPNVGPADTIATISTVSNSTIQTATSSTRATTRPIRHTRSVISLLTVDEQLLFVQKSLQVLFFTEFILLVEFTEVMIPVVYCMYLLVSFYLPNRVCYPHLAEIDANGLEHTVRNVFFYATLELISFCILTFVLKCKLRLSATHQLSFVLEAQWKMVQAKLVMWVVFMLQSTLVHLGMHAHSTMTARSLEDELTLLESTQVLITRSNLRGYTSRQILRAWGTPTRLLRADLTTQDVRAST